MTPTHIPIGAKGTAQIRYRTGSTEVGEQWQRLTAVGCITDVAEQRVMVYAGVIVEYPTDIVLCKLILPPSDLYCGDME